MGMNIGNLDIAAMFVGNSPVTSIWLGATQIYSGDVPITPLETPTDSALFDSQGPLGDELDNVLT